MQLFHISEEDNIQIFYPRIPSRTDMDQTVGLVWAIDEVHLPNFLTPRNCPRVCACANDTSTEEDRTKYFDKFDHVVYIEKKWLEILKRTTLYIYEFATDHFYLQDSVAGYYVSEKAEKPIHKFVVTDLIKELEKRNTELRIVDRLYPIAEEIKKTSFDWSLCRMRYAVK